jgi:hypothetical protein
LRTCTDKTCAVGSNVQNLFSCPEFYSLAKGMKARSGRVHELIIAVPSRGSSRLESSEVCALVLHGAEIVLPAPRGCEGKSSVIQVKPNRQAPLRNSGAGVSPSRLEIQISRSRLHRIRNILVFENLPAGVLQIESFFLPRLQHCKVLRMIDELGLEKPNWMRVSRLF